MMLEYTDEVERKRQLAQLIGIEDRIWIQVEGSSKLYSIADKIRIAKSTTRRRQCTSCALS